MWDFGDKIELLTILCPGLKELKCNEEDEAWVLEWFPAEAGFDLNHIFSYFDGNGSCYLHGEPVRAANRP